MSDDRIPDVYSYTFPQVLEYRAEHNPDDIGIREQKLGIWRDWSWREFRDEAAALGEGILDLGIEPGDRVAFIGDPCFEGVLATIAVQGIGAIPFGMYPTSPVEGVDYLLEDGGAKLAIGEDQEFVDKILDCEKYRGLAMVGDPQGMFSSEYDEVLRWEKVVARGRELRAAGSTRWEESVAAHDSDELCGIYYTSGTTGLPKGAELTHKNVLYGWLCPFYEDTLPGLGNGDRTFHEVPVANLAGPLFGLYFPLVFNLCGHIPDKKASMEEALVEASPTFYLGFPRMWELRASHTLVEVETSSWLHRTAFKFGMALRRYGIPEEGVSRLKPLAALARGLGYLLVARPMLDQWGLLRAKYVLSGGAPLSPDLVKLWRLWGLTIREIYGSTETGGMVSVQTDEVPEPGVAGRAIPYCEIKIADDREILVRGPAVFKRYWRREEATAEVFTEDGWMKTGDIGELRDDGNLKVIDRKRDVLVMKNGAEVPASSIEHVLKYSPYIRDALLVGEGKEHLAALIEIDQDTVAQWARTQGLSYTGFTNLASNPQVRELIDAAVKEANSMLAERESPEVSDFRILPKELDPEDPTEITATRKIRRRQLADKFSDLVEEMYMTEETARIATHARGGGTGSGN